MDTRTAEHICDDIEIRIVNGDLAEGKPLPAERSLMEAYGASRTVIREVITALTAKGFLRSRPRFRPIVCRPDASTAMHAAGGVIKHLLASSQNVHDLYQVRVLCERMLVRDAAVGAQREDIQRLRQALDDNEQAIDDSAQFYATDVAFHRQLYVISGNSAFPAIHQAFVEWLAPQWSQMPRSPERNRTNFLAHQEIFEAILSRDPDLAEKTLISHLDSSWQFVSSTFFAEETP